MKSNPGSFIKRAVLAGMIAGGGVLAASAYAVSADNAADKPRCEAKGGKAAKGDDAAWRAKRAERLEALKQKLELTAAQETAWNAFVEASQHRPGMGAGRHAAGEDFAKLTTPERLERMQAHAETRRAHMATRVEAIRAFYAELTPAQQKVFDAEALPSRRGGHGHHHRHHS